MMLEKELGPLSGSTTITPSSPTREKGPRAQLPTGTLLINARVLMENGEERLALNLLRQASNFEPHNPIVLGTLATALEKMGRDEESLRVWSALEKMECRFEYITQKARCLERLGRDQEALQAYYESLALLQEEHPLLFEIHKNMGNIFLRSGDVDGAMESYHKAFRLRSDSDVLMVNLGTLEMQRSEDERSKDYFRRAVELNPQNDKAWTGLAMIHDRHGDRELAWGNLERALDLNPQNRTAVLIAASWAARDGQLQRGIERLEHYLSEVDSDEDLSLALIQLFCNSGRLDLARLETERLWAWNPLREDVRTLRKTLQQGA